MVAWGEFGRTPRVNNEAGRDHYPNVFSAALAGGPVKGGRVVGASDAKAAFPKANPKTPQDVLATMYRHLGVDTDGAVPRTTPAGRIPVLPSGQADRRLLISTDKQRAARHVTSPASTQSPSSSTPRRS